MDEKEYLREYLRRKEKIKYYRTGASLSIIGGTVLLTIGFVYFLALSGCSFMDRFGPLLFFAALSAPLLILGLWTNSKAADLKIKLEAYDKERERRKAQQPIHPAASGPTA